MNKIEESISGIINEFLADHEKDKKANGSRIFNHPENGYAVAGESCVTSAEGLFAAGDVRTKAVRQVITAAADGANAVISAEKYINAQA